MNLLKTYIREQLIAYMLEANSVQLPEIPPATGGGAIADDGKRTKQARVRFTETAINYLNQYSQYLARKRYFNSQDPGDITIAGNIYDTATQVSNQIKKDTKNWTDIPREIETKLDSLRPDRGALSLVRDGTLWARDENVQQELQPMDLMGKYRQTITYLPQVITALTEYMNFYKS